MSWLFAVLGFALLWPANFAAIAATHRVVRLSDLYSGASLTWDWANSGGRDTFLKAWGLKIMGTSFLINLFVTTFVAWVVVGKGWQPVMAVVLLPAPLLGAGGWLLPGDEKAGGKRSRFARTPAEDPRPMRLLVRRSWLPGAFLGLLVGTALSMLS